MSATKSTLDPLLKDHYTHKKIMNLAVQRTKLYGRLAKQNATSAGGRKFVQPVMYALPGGGSSTFATAQSNTSWNETKSAKFEIAHAKHYRIVQIENEVIELTETGDEDAFLRALKECDFGMTAEMQWIDHRLFRGRGGALGVSSTISGTGITFADPADVVPIRVGSKLALASTDGTSGSLRASGATVVVTAVNRVTGLVTCSTTVSTTISGATSGDYVFFDGDFGLGLTGFADYVVDTDSAAASTLHGLDRTPDISALAGLRVDGTTGASIADVLTDMVTEYINAGGPNESLDLFYNPRTAGQLTKQLDGKWMVEKAGTYNGADVASIGYQNFRVNMAGVSVNLVPTNSCPTKRMYLIDNDTWAFFSAGMAPNFLIKKQGYSLVTPAYNADAWECRIGWYGNLACSAPGYNVVARLP